MVVTVWFETAHRLRHEMVLPCGTMLSFWKSVAGQGAPDGDRGRHRLTVVTGEVFDVLATHLSHHALTVGALEVLRMPEHLRHTSSR